MCSSLADHWFHVNEGQGLGKVLKEDSGMGDTVLHSLIHAYIHIQNI